MQARSEIQILEPTTDNARATPPECNQLPQTCLLTILDAVKAGKFHSQLDVAFPRVHEIFIGGRPGTQVTDITHANQSVIEQGLDDHGQAAIAQVDIERFYDSLDLVNCHRLVLRRGVDPVVATAAIRHHCSPCVVLHSNMCWSCHSSPHHGWLDRFTNCRSTGQIASRKHCA